MNQQQERMFGMWMNAIFIPAFAAAMAWELLKRGVPPVAIVLMIGIPLVIVIGVMIIFETKKGK